MKYSVANSLLKKKTIRLKGTENCFFGGGFRHIYALLATKNSLKFLSRQYWVEICLGMMLSTLASSGNWKKRKKEKILPCFFKINLKKKNFVAEMSQNFDLNKYGFWPMQRILHGKYNGPNSPDFKDLGGGGANNQIFMISSSK